MCLAKNGYSYSSKNKQCNVFTTVVNYTAKELSVQSYPLHRGNQVLMWYDLVGFQIKAVEKYHWSKEEMNGWRLIDGKTIYSVL